MREKSTISPAKTLKKYELFKMTSSSVTYSIALQSKATIFFSLLSYLSNERSDAVGDHGHHHRRDDHAQSDGRYGLLQPHV